MIHSEDDHQAILSKFRDNIEELNNDIKFMDKIVSENYRTELFKIPLQVEKLKSDYNKLEDRVTKNLIIISDKSQNFMAELDNVITDRCESKLNELFMNYIYNSSTEWLDNIIIHRLRDIIFSNSEGKYFSPVLRQKIKHILQRIQRDESDYYKQDTFCKKCSRIVK